MKIKTVAIVGFGALGMLYGAEFLKGMPAEELVFIADADRIRRYRSEKTMVNGNEISFRMIEPKDATPVDLLIFATKYPGLPEAIENARGAADDHTIVMSVLNGISSEQVIAEHLQPKHLLYCSVQGMDATRTGTSVFYSKPGYVAFGAKEDGEKDSVLAVKEFFDRVGMAYTMPEDIVHQLWSKWMLNVGINQTCAYYEVNYAGVHKEGEMRDAMIRAMQEAKAVANAEGIALTQEELEYWINLTDSLSPEGEPSMRQDAKAGRKTEVELFAGMVCKLGHKHGIPVPQNEIYYERFADKN